MGTTVAGVARLCGGPLSSALRPETSSWIANASRPDESSLCALGKPQHLDRIRRGHPQDDGPRAPDQDLPQLGASPQASVLNHEQLAIAEVLEREVRLTNGQVRRTDSEDGRTGIGAAIHKPGPEVRSLPQGTKQRAFQAGGDSDLRRCLGLLRGRLTIGEQRGGQDGTDDEGSKGAKNGVRQGLWYRGEGRESGPAPSFRPIPPGTRGDLTPIRVIYPMRLRTDWDECGSSERPPREHAVEKGLT